MQMLTLLVSKFQVNNNLQRQYKPGHRVASKIRHFKFTDAKLVKNYNGKAPQRGIQRKLEKPIAYARWTLTLYHRNS